MKRVYLEEDEEPHLTYTPQALLTYQERMVRFVLPSGVNALLRHLNALSGFLDHIHKLLYKRECAEAEHEAQPFLLKENYDESQELVEKEEERVLAGLQFAQISELTFEWHGDIMLRGHRMSGLYATCCLIGWASFARAFHLAIYVRDDKLILYSQKSASTDRYCRLVDQTVHVKISDAPLIEYSVTEVWNSMRIVTPTLYQYAYSLPMKEYIYALFFRYGDLLAIEQSEDTLDTVFDHPLFTNELVIEPEQEGKEEEEEEEDEDAALLDLFKQLTVPANAHYSLQSEFLFQGEMLFYHQMYRLHLSSKLTLHPSPSITINYNTQWTRTEFLRLATEKWAEMGIALAEDQQLREHVIGKFRASLTAVHLHHGERERYKCEFTESTCEPRDILNACRPSQMNHITKVQSMILRDIVSTYKKDFLLCLEASTQKNGVPIDLEAHCIQEGTQEWPALPLELECILLTKVATPLWFQLNQRIPLAEVEGQFVMEELVTIDTIDTLLLNLRTQKKATLGKKKMKATTVKEKSKWPIFLKLMRIYYIIHEGRFFRSFFFVEAYLVWLVLVYRGKLIKERSLHPKIIGLVQILNKRLVL